MVVRLSMLKIISEYLLYLLDEKKLSHSYINQAVSAIKLLCKNIFNISIINVDIPRPKGEKKLPVVLSQKEVMKILNSLQNQKHRTILS